VDEQQELATHTRRRLATVTAAAETAAAEAKATETDSSADADATADADGASAETDPSRHVLAALLRPPLYNSDYTSGLGTLYTAAYRPAEGRVEFHWPNARPWPQSFAEFRPGTREIEVG
jgi:hypothetical protein